MPFNVSLLPFAQAQSGGTREIVDKLARTPLSQVVLFVAVLTVLRVVLYPVLKRTPVHQRTVGYAFMRFINEMLDAFIYAGVFVFLLIRPFGVQAFLIPSGSMWPTLHVNDFIVANKAIYRYTDPQVNDIVVFRPPATAAQSPDQLDAQGDMKMDFIKRCVGTPGDLVEMKKGVLYRNGKMLDEPYKVLSHCVDQSQAECQDFQLLTADEVKTIQPASFKLVNYHGSVIPLDYTDFDANSPSPRHDTMSLTDPYRVHEKFIITDPDEGLRAEQLPAVKVPPGMYLMMGDNRNNSDDGRFWGLVPRDQIIGRSEFIWFPLSQIHRTR